MSNLQPYRQSEAITPAPEVHLFVPGPVHKCSPPQKYKVVKQVRFLWFRWQSVTWEFIPQGSWWKCPECKLVHVRSDFFWCDRRGFKDEDWSQVINKMLPVEEQETKAGT